MANESKVKIIISAVDEASKKIDAVGKSIFHVSNLSEQSTKFLKNNAGALAELGAMGVLAGIAINKVTEFTKSSLNETVLYAEQVRDLARALGTSSEEASTLIQVADDLKIPIGSLEIAFRNAIQEGVNPSIDGLKGLSLEYQAIKDPVK